MVYSKQPSVNETTELTLHPKKLPFGRLGEWGGAARVHSRPKADVGRACPGGGQEAAQSAFTPEETQKPCDLKISCHGLPCYIPEPFKLWSNPVGECCKLLRSSEATKSAVRIKTSSGHFEHNCRPLFRRLGIMSVWPVHLGLISLRQGWPGQHYSKRGCPFFFFWTTPEEELHWLSGRISLIFIS